MIACYICNFDIFDNLVAMGIMLTYECLEKATDSLSPNKFKMMSKIMDYKIIPDMNIFNILMRCEVNDSIENNVIDLLLNYGLNMSKNEIFEALENGYYVKDILRCGVQYDEELYYHCHINRIWPDEYKNKFVIDRNILELGKLFLNKKYDVVKKHMIEHNLKPDKYCYENSFFNSDEYISCADLRSIFSDSSIKG